MKNAEHRRDSIVAIAFARRRFAKERSSVGARGQDSKERTHSRFRGLPRSRPASDPRTWRSVVQEIHRSAASAPVPRSVKAGVRISWLLGDLAEASVATYDSAEIVPRQQTLGVLADARFSLKESAGGACSSGCPERVPNCRPSRFGGQRAALSPVVRPAVRWPLRRERDAAPAASDAVLGW